MRTRFTKLICILLTMLMLMGCMPLALAQSPAQPQEKAASEAKSEVKDEPTKAAFNVRKSYNYTLIKGVEDRLCVAYDRNNSDIGGGWYNDPEVVGGELPSGTHKFSYEKVSTELYTAENGVILTITASKTGNYTAYLSVPFMDYSTYGDIYYIYEVNIKVVNSVSDLKEDLTFSAIWYGVGYYYDEDNVSNIDFAGWRNEFYKEWMCNCLTLGNLPTGAKLTTSNERSTETPFAKLTGKWQESLENKTFTFYLMLNFRDAGQRLIKVRIIFWKEAWGEPLTFTALQGARDRFHFPTRTGATNGEEMKIVKGELPLNNYYKMEVADKRTYINIEPTELGHFEIWYRSTTHSPNTRIVAFDVTNDVNNFYVEDNFYRNYEYGKAVADDVFYNPDAYYGTTLYYTIIRGNLPSGLRIDKSSNKLCIAGTPTESGAFFVYVRITSENGTFAGTDHNRVSKLKILVTGGTVVADEKVKAQIFTTSVYGSRQFYYDTLDEGDVQWASMLVKGTLPGIDSELDPVGAEYPCIEITDANYAGTYKFWIAAEYKKAGIITYEIELQVVDKVSDFNKANTVTVEHTALAGSSAYGTLVETTEQNPILSWGRAIDTYEPCQLFDDHIPGPCTTVFMGGGFAKVPGVYPFYVIVQFKDLSIKLYECIITLEEKQAHNVTFVDGVTGDVIAMQKVEYGHDATLPTPPTHQGYTFIGWEGSYTGVVNNQTVTAIYGKNTNAVAKNGAEFELVLGEVNANYPNVSSATMVVDSGELPEGLTGKPCEQGLKISGVPTKNGTSTSSWKVEYSNKAGTEKWAIYYTVTITVSDDISGHTVTFVDGVTKETIKTVTVVSGGDVTLPTAPDHTAEGYKFTAWDHDGKNITADITITANYVMGYKLGDVNGDGLVNTGDAVSILKIAAGMIEFNEKQTNIADVNGDSLVNTGDAVSLLKAAAGMIEIPETWVWVEE